MRRALHELDQILRGEATRVADLREGGLVISARRLSVVVFVLAALYGLCMGAFGLFHADGPVWQQAVASAAKVPALFLLTLVVTFPSLYVFNALVGSQLGVLSVLRLLVASLGVNLAVLSSLGPIVAFFAVSTTSYAFMVLLNVLAFSAAGALGLLFLLQTLHRLSVASEWAALKRLPPLALPVNLPAPPEGEEPAAEEPAPPPPATPAADPGALDRLAGHVLGGHVKTVFGCWIFLFGLVGAQLGWLLRPFIGNPDQPFTWFRPRSSNFFEAVWGVLQTLWG
ncbi:MAG: hypothetical protein U0836_03300 [Pirellulales bacterium]